MDKSDKDSALAAGQTTYYQLYPHSSCQTSQKYFRRPKSEFSHYQVGANVAGEQNNNSGSRLFKLNTLKKANFENLQKILGSKYYSQMNQGTQYSVPHKEQPRQFACQSQQSIFRRGLQQRDREPPRKEPGPQMRIEDEGSLLNEIYQKQLKEQNTRYVVKRDDEGCGGFQKTHESEKLREDEDSCQIPQQPDELAAGPAKLHHLNVPLLQAADSISYDDQGSCVQQHPLGVNVQEDFYDCNNQEGGDGS